MKFGRRNFLKLLGATAATALVAPEVPKLVTPAPSAPLYVPSQRLDFGVPRRILTATEMPPSSVGFYGHAPVSYRVEGPPGLQPVAEIPMLLAHDEFRPPGWEQFGRQRVPAGTTLWVDRPTAERWIENGVGTAAPTAPMDLQMASATRAAARQSRVSYDEWETGMGRDFDWEPGVYTRVPAPLTVEAKDRHWGRLIERASERIRRAAPDPAMAWWDEPAVGEETA